MKNLKEIKNLADSNSGLAFLIVISLYPIITLGVNYNNFTIIMFMSQLLMFVAISGISIYLHMNKQTLFSALVVLFLTTYINIPATFIHSILIGFQDYNDFFVTIYRLMIPLVFSLWLYLVVISNLFEGGITCYKRANEKRNLLFAIMFVFVYIISTNFSTALYTLLIPVVLLLFSSRLAALATLIVITFDYFTRFFDSFINVVSSNSSLANNLTLDFYFSLIGSLLLLIFVSIEFYSEYKLTYKVNSDNADMEVSNQDTPSTDYQTPNTDSDEKNDGDHK